MRWDHLFDDLESQLEQGMNADDSEILIEDERLRLGRLTLHDRIASVVRSQDAGGDWSLRLVIGDGSTIAIRVSAFGKDWLSGSVADATGHPQRQVVLPSVSITGVILTPDQLAASLDPMPDSGARGLTQRLSLAFMLRDLCRRRLTVDVRTRAGSLHGTFDRIGKDHVDLAMHDPSVPRRRREVTQLRVIPFTELTLILI